MNANENKTKLDDIKIVWILMIWFVWIAKNLKWFQAPFEDSICLNKVIYIIIYIPEMGHWECLMLDEFGNQELFKRKLVS